mgnify:CR=1 FL=1
MNKSQKKIIFVTYAGVLPFYLSPVIGYYDYNETLVRFSEIKMISSLYAALIVCFLSGMQWQKIIEANIKGFFFYSPLIPLLLVSTHALNVNGIYSSFILVLSLFLNLSIDLILIKKKSDIIKKISITGSTRVGKLILKQAADKVQRVTMELSGHSPFIVFDDVDINKVADMAITAKFRNNGQVCISPNRFYIQEKKKDEFIKAFIERTKKLKIGNGLDKDVQLGPLTTSKRLGEIEELVEITKKEGAKVLLGGKRPSGFNKGYFYEPTIFDDVKDWSKKLTYNPSIINDDKRISYKPEMAMYVEKHEPLKQEIEAFLQCVSNKEIPITDIQEGLNVQIVLNMIEKKLKEKYF